MGESIFMIIKSLLNKGFDR